MTKLNLEYDFSALADVDAFLCYGEYWVSYEDDNDTWYVDNGMGFTRFDTLADVIEYLTAHLDSLPIDVRLRYVKIPTEPVINALPNLGGCADKLWIERYSQEQDTWAIFVESSGREYHEPLAVYHTFEEAYKRYVLVYTALCGELR